MLKQLSLSVLAAVLLMAATAASAEEMQGMGNMEMNAQPQGAAAQIHQGHGVVNKINAQAGKLNITHEPIESMGWPRMTMDFTVQDKASLAGIKPGMKVDFELTVKGKGYRITHIAPAKE